MRRDFFLSLRFPKRLRRTASWSPSFLPVGYNDGYDRLLSNSSYVLVKGKRAPLRGRVAMNFMMADVTDIQGVRLEDEVVLITRRAEVHGLARG